MEPSRSHTSLFLSPETVFPWITLDEAENQFELEKKLINIIIFFLNLSITLLNEFN